MSTLRTSWPSRRDAEIARIEVVGKLAIFRLPLMTWAA